MFWKRVLPFLLVTLALSACEWPLTVFTVEEVTPVASPTMPEPQMTPTLISVAPPTLTPIPPAATPEDINGVESDPATSTPIPPTFTPTAVVLPYMLQSGSPNAIPNFSHPELGCNWLGVAGQVFGIGGEPQQFLVLEIGGDLAGSPVSLLSLTGAAPIYGPGGYEFTLSDRPIGSSGEMWIRIFDLNGNRLSETYYFDTFNDCGQNLILVNFVSIPVFSNKVYLPSLLQDLPAVTPTP